MNKLKALINHFKLATTMNTLFDEWLDSKRHLKAQSIRTYTQLLEGYLRPAFGEMAVKEIRKETIQKFIDNMQKKYSAKTIHEVYRCLKTIFNLALRQGMIENNPCEKIILPPKEKTQAQSLSIKEQNKLEKALEPSENALDIAILLALNLGLRLSEVVALRWQDIRFKENLVVIRHSMERIPTGEGRKTEARLGKPKTQNALRKIPLTAEFSAFLKHYYNSRNLKQKKNAAYVAGKKDGTAYHGRSIERHFKKRMKELGLSKDYTFHSLRHSFATRAMESGVAVKVISALLGHSKTATTTEIYLHLSDHFIREEMMKMTKYQAKKRRRSKTKVPPVNAA